jgi:hypothetical protein
VSHQVASMYLQEEVVAGGASAGMTFADLGLPPPSPHFIVLGINALVS